MLTCSSLSEEEKAQHPEFVLKVFVSFFLFFLLVAFFFGSWWFISFWNVSSMLNFFSTLSVGSRFSTEANCQRRRCRQVFLFFTPLSPFSLSPSNRPVQRFQWQWQWWRRPASSFYSLSPSSFCWPRFISINFSSYSLPFLIPPPLLNPFSTFIYRRSTGKQTTTRKQQQPITREANRREHRHTQRSYLPRRPKKDLCRFHWNWKGVCFDCGWFGLSSLWLNLFLQSFRNSAIGKRHTNRHGGRHQTNGSFSFTLPFPLFLIWLCRWSPNKPKKKSWQTKSWLWKRVIMRIL